MFRRALNAIGTRHDNNHRLNNQQQQQQAPAAGPSDGLLSPEEMKQRGLESFGPGTQLEQLRPATDDVSNAFRIQQQTGNETWAIAFAPDSSFIAWSCGNKRVLLVPWCLTQNRPMQAPAPTAAAAAVDSPKPLILNCGDTVWSLAFGSPTSDEKNLQLLAKRRHRYHKFHESHDLLLAVGLGGGRIKIWSVTTGRLYLELADHRNVVRDLKFNPNGSLVLVSASRDSTLKLWDLADDGNMFKTLKGHKKGEWVYCCSWSPNSELVASGGADKMIILWRSADWKIERRLQGHHHSVSSVEFSKDGAILASASYDTSVILWDPWLGTKFQILWHMIPPPRPIYANGENDHFVRSLALSRDGEHVATICDDGYLRVWDVFAKDKPAGIVDVANGLICVYSPDGYCLSVGTREGRAAMFSAPMQIPQLSHLCRMVIRKAVQRTPDVSRLPLPARVQSFLRYEDIIDHSTPSSPPPPPSSS